MHYSLSDNDLKTTYWNLLRAVRPYLGYFLIGVFGSVVYAISNGAFARYFKPLIDEGLVRREPTFVVTIPFIIIGYFVVRGIGSFIDTYFMGKVGRSVVRDFRRQLLTHILYLPAQFYQTHPSGELISKINYDTEQIAHTLSDGIPSVLRGIFSTLAYIAVMFMINWRITVMLLLAGPILIYYINHISRRMRNHSSNIQNTMGNLTQVGREITEGYREIRTFSGYDYEKNRIADVTKGNFSQEMQMVRTIAVSVPFMQLIGATAMAGLLYLSMLSPEHRFGTGLTAGEFGAMFLAMLQLMRPVKQIAVVNSVIQRGVMAAKSVLKVLSELPELDTGVHSLTNCSGKIEFRNVDFSYPGRSNWSLQNIDLVINPGETVAIVGESGSGKSTFINLLARFHLVLGGEILLDNIPINNLKLANLRQQLAIVSQHVILFNGTVRDNIAYGCNMEKTNVEITEAARLAYANEFIEKLPYGFDTEIGENGLMLSGGQRQRLAIARAILKNAPILIFDEATSALDNQSELYIQSALKYLVQNRTTFIIAHRLSTIKQADKIIVLANGKIVEFGRFSELLAEKTSHFTRIYNAQFN